MANQTQKLTPMMRHYLEVKQQHEDAILLYRLGDFYEMFFDDAVIASKELELTLTSRDRNSANPIPMCGVPHHAADGYIRRLLDAGFKVAICEQVEDPKQAKGMVRREVVRVLTPALNVEEEGYLPNYLVSVFENQEEGVFGMALLDLSTGEFKATELSSLQELVSELSRTSARELIYPASQESTKQAILAHLPNIVPTPRPEEAFQRAEGRILSFFGASSLEGYGLSGHVAATAAAAAAIEYMEQTQKSAATHIEGISYFETKRYMVIDENALAHLEIVSSASGSRKDTLLGVLDFTNTRQGLRMLRNWLLYPLRNIDEINQRLNAVEALYSASSIRQALLDALKGVADIERSIARLALGRGNARDLVAIKEALLRLPEILALLAPFGQSMFEQIRQGLIAPEGLSELLDSAIVENPPMSITEGGMFKKGFNEELDELIELATEGKAAVLSIEAKEREATGIPSLKVKYNKVFGYYIEVTKTHLSKVPPHYVRKQTIANGERYITDELKRFEERILGAEAQRKNLEAELFERLRQEVLSHSKRIRNIATQLAKLDVLCSAAEAAERFGYVRPIMEDSLVLQLRDSRHPVVERTLKEERFVPNDVELDGGSKFLMIITGPNMAGKSTIMRQVALISIMAQAGLFVPASSARIGIIDRIFTRIGASDIISRGKSTFLVEMEETSKILHQATRNSLILLDEIGRGTSTFDGVSIAWAVAEYIHDAIGARTMFATHYHELTELELTCPGVVNYNVSVKEWGGEVIFLRKLVRGGTNHSYGIHVAKMAGLPTSVLERARNILADLEKMAMQPPGRESSETPEPFKPRKRRRKGPTPTYQPSLFDWANDKVKRISKIEQLIANIDTERISPMEALQLLAELKSKLNE